MLFATIVRCPVIGGKVKSWDNNSIASIEGIVKVFEMKAMGEKI